MLFLREEHIVELLPMRDAIAVVREAFHALAGGTARNQPRRRLALGTGAMLHVLAGATHGYFGTKVYSTHPRHGAHFMVLLYHSETGQPLALLEANHLGQIRTGAATGLATDLLANPDASALAVIGSGFQARTQIQAIAEVRRLREVRVWSRNAARRDRFAAGCARDFGLTVRAAASAEGCVRGAPIVVTATYSKDPVLEAEWIADGAHVNAVGSNHPERRELPPEAIARASLIAVDSLEQARIESGDLLLAWPQEEWNSSRLVELQDVVAGRAARPSPSAVTLFKSNGLGVEDIAAGALVYERARAKGVGEDLKLTSAN
jgi:ornithine cyclodeaminase/alanine dehydrogenase-like protein (mu-crystallin family)